MASHENILFESYTYLILYLHISPTFTLFRRSFKRYHKLQKEQKKAGVYLRNARVNCQKYLLHHPEIFFRWMFFALYKLP